MKKDGGLLSAIPPSARQGHQEMSRFSSLCLMKLLQCLEKPGIRLKAVLKVLFEARKGGIILAATGI